jgi:hypothetical protein
MLSILYRLPLAFFDYCLLSLHTSSTLRNRPPYCAGIPPFIKEVFLMASAIEDGKETKQVARIVHRRIIQ